MPLCERDLVRCLAPTDRASLFAASTLRTCRRGELICSPDEPGPGLLLIKRGCVQSYWLSGSGRKLVLGEYGAGTLFGLLALMDDGRYGVFAEVAEPSLLCVLPTALLRRLAQREPRLAWRLFEAAGEDLHRALAEEEKLAFRTQRARLAGMLVELSEQHGLALAGLTQQDLADRVGTHRETVSVLLGELRRIGAIALRPQLQILDTTLLRALAAADERAPGRAGPPALDTAKT
jgi:CRP-like cAMP-binding protein